MYDFSRCKLCGEQAAVPKYSLPQMTVYACGNCDFHSIDALDDFPPEQPEGTLLTEKSRKFIESKLPQNRKRMKKNLRFIRAHLSPTGRHCLDIGSGVGLFPALWQKAGGVAQGIEPQQIFREFAQENFQLRLRRELIEDPCWQIDCAEIFDLVTIWDTLEHVNFPAETLKAACRVIKPGGHLFLDTPSRDAFSYRVSEWSYRLSRGSKPLLLNRLYSPKPYRHKQIFTQLQLTALLGKIGLSVVGRSDYHRSGTKLVVVCQKNVR